MPGSILNADTGFPQFKDGQSTSEKLDVVMNYLYMLLEQLRYSMGNLDEKNFNPSGLEQLQKTITEPIYVELFDEETGKVTRLAATADGLTARLNNFQVNPFSPAGTYEVGACVAYEGKVYRCITAVTTPGAWDPTKWEETAAGSIEAQLTATNQNINTKISSDTAQSMINQTVGSITLAVDDGAGKQTTIGAFNNGVLIASTGLITNAGLVVFKPNDPDNPSAGGYSMINGGVIKSQVIDASLITGGTIGGAIIYGTNGLYGPEVITRRDTGETYTYGQITRYIYEQLKTNPGGIEFGTIYRQWHAPFARTENGKPDASSIAEGTYTKFGGIFASYEDDRLYVSTEGALGKRLKLVSGYDLSITAKFTTNQPDQTPGGEAPVQTYTIPATGGSTGLYGGRIFIGAETQTIGAYDRGQEVRIGNPYGHVMIIPYVMQNDPEDEGKDTESTVSNAYEFRSDGIYYNGHRVVDSSRRV